MTQFDYVRAGSVAEAISLLNDPAQPSRPLAGGTDLLVYTRHQAPEFSRVVDISLLPELKAIQQEGNHLSLGAGVTFAEVVESELLQATVPFLVAACRAIGGPQIRNMGTIGGNVINAAACADSLPPLVCLEAIVHLRSPEGERTLPLSEFVVWSNQTKLQPGELLTHFNFEVPPAGSQTAFLKLGRRNAQAISRLTMAAIGRVDEAGQIDFIRLTPGSATPQPMRFTQAEALLLGQRPSVELVRAAGRQVADTMIDITGRRWSTEFKERAVAALAERALARLFGLGDVISGRGE